MTVTIHKNEQECLYILIYTCNQYNIYKYLYKYVCMHNKCKINGLAVTDQVGRFCKTNVAVQYTEMLGQVPDWIYV